MLAIASFLGLCGISAPGVSLENLSAGSWGAVPSTFPFMALAYIYQSVVPVVLSSLEGDIAKTRQAVVIGLAIPLVMFVGWEAAILGSIPAGTTSPDPVQALKGMHSHGCVFYHALLQLKVVLLCC